MITLYVRPAGPTSPARLARAGQTAWAFGAVLVGGNQPTPGPNGSYAIRVYKVDLLEDLKLALAEHHSLESVAEHPGLENVSEAQAEAQRTTPPSALIAAVVLGVLAGLSALVGFELSIWSAVIAAAAAVAAGLLARRPVRGHRQVLVARRTLSRLSHHRADTE
jgi:hypothetical protein